MPEIKNTFLKSKMNKDLDARIIPSGEYRDGKNISISASEGADVGALENIRGNFNLTNFGLTDDNLEVIGTVVDEAKNRIYFFITNFSDASADSSFRSTPSTVSGQFTINGAKHCIAYCQIPFEEDANISSNTIISEVLVEGAFLNFSKTHPVASNVLEDFLFFTDDRNQPRKINVETAIANPLTYYTHEDHISVAKFAPFNPISFLNDTISPSKNTLLNEKDYWMPAIFLSPGKVFVGGGASYLIFDDLSVYGSPAGRYASPAQHFGSGNSKPDFDIRVYRVNDENKRFAYIKKDQNDSIVIDANTNRVQVQLYSEYDTVNGNVSGNVITDIGATLGWDNGTFAFEIKNPQYNAQFSGDADFLKEKFVKFSYRFKYDDDEYSLLAPFSQHAFVPKQYGYFIGDDDNKTKESSIVDFMENQITTAGLVVDLPYTVNTIEDTLKVKEIQLIYKASDEKSLKVVADMKIDDIPAIPTAFNIISSEGGYTAGTVKTTSGGSGTGLKLNIATVNNGIITSVTLNDAGTGYRVGDIVTIAPTPSGTRPARIQITQLSNKFVYNYTSQKPIKVLDEQEIIRVNDIVPMRAKTQEIVGNRVVYGNFLQNKSTPISLNYDVSSGEKTGDNKKEFLNHTLKQGRTYQVGLVLQDRYGRSSNVIVNNNPMSRTLNSTFFSEYTNGGADPLRWPGNCLKVSFNQEIPTQATSTYNGIYDEFFNPLGWYTYKVVVKQQDQDYYNVYTPGGLSGNINFERLDIALSFNETSSIFQIPLINDNINKIPRDLKQVGPNDDIFGSSISLFPRVSNTVSQTDNTVNFPNDSNSYSNDVNEQSIDTKQSTVDTVKDFVDFGKWTAYKNINVRFVDSTTTADSAGAVEVTGPYVPSSGGPYTPSDLNTSQAFYIYPGATGNVDPVFLKNNKNPLIATISTTKRLGFNVANQIAYKFAKDLCVLETKPFKSNLEIYYETSNTGLISDFNTSVATPVGVSGEPVGISDFVATFRESTSFPQDISNVFQAVDRNGTPITNSEPTITMKVERIVQNARTPDVTSDFNLSIVQQPSFNTPPTYKITTAKPFIYNSDSEAQDNYNFILSLRSNTSPNITKVTKSASLTNVTPSILTANAPVFAVDIINNQAKFIPDIEYGGINILQQNRLEYKIKAHSDSEINSIITNSNFNSFTITNPGNNGDPIQGETEITARVIPRSQIKVVEGVTKHNNVLVLRALHTNNGAASMPTTLNNSNRNNNVPTASLVNGKANGGLLVSTYKDAILNDPENRIKGVSYSLESVRRGIVIYNDNGQFKFEKQDSANPRNSIGIPPTSINDLEDKIRDFYCDSKFGNVYFRPGGDGQGSVKNKLQNQDMPIGSPASASMAWAYIIKLKISDAGSATNAGSLSGFANFIWIVTKQNTFNQPKTSYT